MNKRPTYAEQWQKITSAYLNNELDPYDSCACFIGNLLNNKNTWAGCRTGDVIIGKGFLIPSEHIIFQAAAVSFIKSESVGLYSPQDIVDLENNFLKTLLEKCNNPECPYDDNFDCADTYCIDSPNYENAIYEAMVSTLELLRQIHISKGESVDPIEFNMRVLTTT